MKYNQLIKHAIFTGSLVFSQVTQAKFITFDFRVDAGTSLTAETLSFSKDGLDLTVEAGLVNTTTIFDDASPAGGVFVSQFNDGILDNSGGLGVNRVGSSDPNDDRVNDSLQMEASGGFTGSLFNEALFFNFSSDIRPVEVDIAPVTFSQAADEAVTVLIPSTFFGFPFGTPSGPYFGQYTFLADTNSPFPNAIDIQQPDFIPPDFRYPDTGINSFGLTPSTAFGLDNADFYIRGLTVEVLDTTQTQQPSPVPEPTTLLLMSTVILAGGFVRKKQS